MTGWMNRNTSIVLVSGLIVLYILSAIVNLGHFNLQGEEPRRAIISIEMMQSGDYIVPHTLGWEYYNKPPLFNWILSGFMSLTGSESEFVSRIPSLLFLLIWGFCHYLICRKWFSKKLSLLSTFLLLTSADIFFYGLANGAEIDIFYSLVVYFQIISMFWFYEQKKWWPLFLLSWLFCAIGFLTKGLPSIMFQGLTLVALCVHARSIKLLFKPQQFAGIALFVLCAGSYFYAYSNYGDPSVMLTNIVNESLKKSAVGEESAGRLYKIISYPGLLFKLLAPWCLILLVLLKPKRFTFFDSPLVRFSFLFIVFNIGIYWITGVGKLRYIYMFIPFAMNIFVYLYGQFEQRNPGLFNKYLKYAGIIFCLVLGGIVVLPFFYEMNFWLVAGSAIMFLFFLIAYFKQNDHRIWLFVTGLILIRLIYAAIGIPIQSKGSFDFKPMMASMAQKANGQPVSFFLPADTLKLDIVVGDTLVKWKKDPIVVPPFLFHQIPYYYYRSSGSIMQYDTAITTGKTYISYDSLLKNKEIERIFAAFDKRAKDSLVLFRLKPALQ
jgi:4-amino-4-deoxy-L-arabinose transferase-like glycosyltransferase